MQESKPLVSICVLSYKSASTIVETLESIKNQSYPNIELIVTDDCSPDDSVAIVNNWIKENETAFTNARVITSARNTGTAGNCNRAVKAASGEWIKLIAGDDMLTPDCISVLIEFSQSRKGAELVCGKISWFGMQSDAYGDEFWRFNEGLFKMMDEDVKLQHWYFVRKNFIPASGVMLKKSLWEKVNGFDEEVELLEDWPMWIKCIEAGAPFHFTDKVVALYRMSEGSVRINPRFSYSVLLFKYKYIYNRPKWTEWIRKHPSLKKKTLFSKVVFKLLSIISPLFEPQWS